MNVYDAPESQILGGHKAIKEDVDAITDTKGHGHDTVGTGRAVQHAHKVREVVKNLEKESAEGCVE